MTGEEKLLGKRISMHGRRWCPVQYPRRGIFQQSFRSLRRQVTSKVKKTIFRSLFDVVDPVPGHPDGEQVFW